MMGHPPAQGDSGRALSLIAHRYVAKTNFCSASVLIWKEKQESISEYIVKFSGDLGSVAEFLGWANLS